MPEEEIGRVGGYFAKIGVAGIDLSGELRLQDTIHIHGHTTDLTQTVESIQIDNEAVEEAGAGASVGIKVGERCRKGDHVYKILA